MKERLKLNAIALKGPAPIEVQPKKRRWKTLGEESRMLRRLYCISSAFVL